MNAKSKKVLSIIGGFAMGIFLLAIGWQDFQNSRKLKIRGQTTVGQVLESEERNRRKAVRSYYLKVQFRTEAGQSITKRIKVNKDTFKAATTEGSVQVFYLAGEPEICAAGESVQIRFWNFLFGFLMIGGTGYLLIFFKQPDDQDELAESITESLKPLSQGKHEYATVNVKNFKHLDLAFYDNNRKNLESSGFIWLADEENLTAQAANKGLRVFLRTFVHPQTRTMAALYHWKPGWMLRVLKVKECKVLDLETWFSNGTFVCTNNAESAGMLESPEGIDVAHLPAQSSWDTVLKIHQQRVAQFMERNPGVSPVAINTLEEMHRAQDELQRIKAAFRQKTGLSKIELEKLAGTKGEAVDDLHRLVAKTPSRQIQETK